MKYFSCTHIPVRLLYSITTTAILMVFIVLSFDVFYAATTSIQSSFYVTQMQTIQKFQVHATQVSKLFHVPLQDLVLDVTNFCIYDKQAEKTRDIILFPHKSPLVKYSDNQSTMYIKTKCADQDYFETHEQIAYSKLAIGMGAGIALCMLNIAIVLLIWMFCTGWCKCSGIEKQFEQMKEMNALLENKV
ncbi:Hypothetical_protein [Hexamita inflata]|uniref:Hypothetical_protein n=1 Tax=Hexamita inflata TaxID=28002 RepID=A0AA86PIQ3_9EUKA|nr:Hypothetical protein HINF_LOCUS26801 [Hexamita inflata]